MKKLRTFLPLKKKKIVYKKPRGFESFIFERERESEKIVERKVQRAMSGGIARGRLAEERKAWRKNHPHVRAPPSSSVLSLCIYICYVIFSVFLVITLCFLIFIWFFFLLFYVFVFERVLFLFLGF